MDLSFHVCFLSFRVFKFLFQLLRCVCTDHRLVKGQEKKKKEKIMNNSGEKGLMNAKGAFSFVTDMLAGWRGKKGYYTHVPVLKLHFEMVHDLRQAVRLTMQRFNGQGAAVRDRVGRFPVSFRKYCER